MRGIAQSGRALRSGRRGRRFESCYPDQLNKKCHPKDGIFLFNTVVGMWFDIL